MEMQAQNTMLHGNRIDWYLPTSFAYKIRHHQTICESSPSKFQIFENFLSELSGAKVKACIFVRLQVKKKNLDDYLILIKK